MRRCARYVAAMLCTVIAQPLRAQTAAGETRSGPARDAAAFMQAAESTLADLNLKVNRADWVAANFITDDTEALSADANRDFSVAVQRFAMSARRYEHTALPAELRRKFTLLKLSLSAPPPGNAAEATELAKLRAAMEAEYGKGAYCRPAPAGAATKEECLQINELSKILAQSRSPDTLLDVWRGWHRVGVPLRAPFTRFVQLSNKGARELGFADAGAMWRSQYDMPPEALAAEVERLWQQVRPLYLSLHAYVRTRLGEAYGTRVVPPDGLIPAHLLGNMWAQDWTNIYPLVAPSGGGGRPDITKLLADRKVDERGMVGYGERFFTSLGFEKLPTSFWTRSLITKPRDREVVCHASAWDVDSRDDLRIKMCTEVTEEDFRVVHHELGHNFYQRAYKDQPFLFRNGANDAFHEAVGDAIALSITPSYLHTIGLLATEPVVNDTTVLLRMALDGVAFLPFGLLIDQWRWKVFSGELQPADYNAAWWALRNKYQGISAPLPRSAADFDPGAKFHVAANVSYTRYFLARILEFQFYRALCAEAGHTGPLHRCSFYGNKAAGKKLEAMLRMGQSKPWPEALFAMTGQRNIDASAMVEYFAPLQRWLDEQNRGRKVGW